MRNLRGSPPVLIDLDGLDALITRLGDRGYSVVGPTAEGGVIDYGQIGRAADLPIGWDDDQQPGRYRATKGGAGPSGGDSWVFGFANAVSSPKRFLYPPREVVVSAIRGPGGDLRFGEPATSRSPLALVGVRSCELNAIAILDRVLIGGDHRDERYGERRRSAFVVAVECEHPGGTCFCSTMSAGPSIDPEDPVAASVVDLILTEIPGQRFVVRQVSDEGHDMVSGLSVATAGDESLALARELVDGARNTMASRLDVSSLHGAMKENPDHQAWDRVALRCLSCTSCTLLCPTCFCVSTAESSNLRGDEASRERVWDSCFSESFSYLHGGSVRVSIRSRYRQWATHKLATWQDQFATSGCVGCGRCITWCPAGIDITEVARSLQGVPP